ncbi:MAG: uracil-DNA glycosylase [Chloroflexi bacterium]|nr:uracil-DNA glycosylase [Chloroflexota bacterium]
MRFPEERQRRLDMLGLPHMAKLKEYVDAIRAARGVDKTIPYFDSLDGGIDAKALFLLEAPGARAVESGFISRNNCDPTARNTCGFLWDAGIPRAKTILWNIVPWYVGDNRGIRAASSEDIREGMVYLPELFKMLSDLNLVVLVGREAQHATNQIERITNGVEIVDMYHPSQRVLNRWPHIRNEIQKSLGSVAKVVHQ